MNLKMISNSYTDFALIYDRLTDDVEYEKRADYTELLIKKHFSGKPELICDLGCGTGSMCSILSSRGYDCIGIDSSENMLSVAAEKSAGKNILYLNQDMCDFELYGTVDVMLCMLDSMNYVINPEDLNRMFSLVSNYLNPGGIFIFDVNTKYKFEKILGSNTYVYETDGIFYTWENYYEDGILDFELNFFVKQGASYSRITEQHRQRYYSAEELKSAAERNSLKAVGIYGDMSMSNPLQNSERVFLVVKK